jgi:DNA-binding response OmpR family regulator
MSAGQTVARGPAATPCILLVDDDRRILELLEIAFAAHGFRVLTAPDGDAAMKCVLTERPDLLVLDVRLPKKSGLEVCEWLRRDPDDPSVPVIMVSAVVDMETRLQAFTRGADDYLTKPFSPKELIARVKRLLARSTEARAARARQHELERESAHARESAQRSHAATKHEQRLRDLELGPGLDLLGADDEDELARRLLPLIRSRLGSTVVGLLLPGNDGAALVPAAVRGDGPERLAGLALPRTGALAALLAGLDRPVVRRDLERFPDLAVEVAPFVAEGVALLAPLRGPGGLEGLLVLDERRDGLPFPASELEALASIARFAGVALHHARRVRALAERALVELEGREAPEDDGRRARAEAGFLVEHAAQAALVPPRQRRLLAHAIRLGRGAAQGDGAKALARLAADDPTGLARDLVALFARADAPAAGGDDDPATGDGRAAVLLAVALLLAVQRERGEDTQAALARALATAGRRLDPITRQALEAAARELALVVIEAA